MYPGKMISCLTDIRVDNDFRKSGTGANIDGGSPTRWEVTQR